MKLLSIVPLGLFLFVAGCKPADEEELVDAERPPIPFDGAADARFVGQWKSADGKQAYAFSEDGRFDSETKVPNRGSAVSMKASGEWKVKGTQMLFRDRSGAVVPYDLHLTGNTLTLTTVGSLKNKTVLKKG